MAKTKKQKVILLEEYKQKLKSHKGFIVVRPKKITPTEISELKKELFKFDSSINVVKNSIAKLAIKENNLPEVEDLNGFEHAFLYLGEDIVNPIKTIKKFIQDTKSKDGNTKFEIITGILDGELISKETVVDLAEMPDVRGSVAQILGILDNAISSVVNVLEDPLRSYVSVLDQAFKQ